MWMLSSRIVISRRAVLKAQIKRVYHNLIHPLIFTSLERNSAEVAVDEQTVYSFQVELTSFLSYELYGKEFRVTVFEQEVVTAVDKCGIECLLSRSVQAVVGEVYHVLHASSQILLHVRHNYATPAVALLM